MSSTKSEFGKPRRYFEMASLHLCVLWGEIWHPPFIQIIALCGLEWSMKYPDWEWKVWRCLSLDPQEAWGKDRELPPILESNSNDYIIYISFACWGQSTVFGNWYSPTMWVSVIELRLSVLKASAFTLRIPTNIMVIIIFLYALSPETWACTELHTHVS